VDDKSPEPEDPFIGEMDAEAIEHHEMYQSWQRAGFTEEEAMSLLKDFIRTEMYIAADAEEEEP
jgi:hypothetical protein